VKVDVGIRRQGLRRKKREPHEKEQTPTGRFHRSPSGQRIPIPLPPGTDYNYLFLKSFLSKKWLQRNTGKNIPHLFPMWKTISIAGGTYADF
jgi:hypothetical protein